MPRPQTDAHGPLLLFWSIVCIFCSLHRKTTYLCVAQAHGLSAAHPQCLCGAHAMPLWHTHIHAAPVADTHTHTSLWCTYSVSVVHPQCLCGTHAAPLWHRNSLSVARARCPCGTHAVPLRHRHSVSLWHRRSVSLWIRRRVGGRQAAGGLQGTPELQPHLSSPTHHTHKIAIPTARGD